MKGKLVVLEGIDGAGTETQSKLLLSYLKKKNIPAERIYFPNYSGPIGKLLKKFQRGEFDLPVETQFLLYASDMVNHSRDIKTWLSEGKTVVCDRYITTTMAYQGLRGFPLEKALKFVDIFGLPKPDSIIYLRIKPETSIKRKRKEKPESMDRNEKNLQLHRDVSEQYEKLIEKDIWSKWYAVDGEKNIEDVQKQILKILKF